MIDGTDDEALDDLLEIVTLTSFRYTDFGYTVLHKHYLDLIICKYHNNSATIGRITAANPHKKHRYHNDRLLSYMALINRIKSFNKLYNMVILNAVLSIHFHSSTLLNDCVDDERLKI